MVSGSDFQVSVCTSPVDGASYAKDISKEGFQEKGHKSQVGMKMAIAWASGVVFRNCAPEVVSTVVSVRVTHRWRKLSPGMVRAVSIFTVVIYLNENN